jgi:hypothetical protein
MRNGSESAMTRVNCRTSSGPLRNADRKPPGFLLIVVVGLLAILLVMVVGFLSYTRGETNAVATIRDRTDGVNMFHSVLDWTAASIASDLCDGSGLMRAGLGDDPKGIVSSVNAPGDACYKWWYRPYEPNMQAWYAAAVPSNHATQWCDLPQKYFNSQSIKGRYYVQVFDANALLNVNDNLEDGNPTQCQAAHMLMESLGDQYLEHYRRWRDTKVNSGNAYAAPLRYLHAWRMATHTLRSNNTANNTGYSEYDTISPNWVTTNQSYMSLHDLDLNSFRIEWQAAGIPPWVHVSANSTLGPGNYFPPTRREGFVPGNGEWGFVYWSAYSAQAPSYFGGSGLNWPTNNHFVCMLTSYLYYALWS